MNLINPHKFKNKYRTKSTRLHGYNYTQPGYYFITICTHNRINYFGQIINGKMKLSSMGRIADKYWYQIPNHFPLVTLDKFVIMPNHIHGIIVINDRANSAQNFEPAVEAQNLASLHQTNQYKNKFGSQSCNLASIVRGFKIGVTKYARINGLSFQWQPRYYDRIIRNSDGLERIRCIF